VLGSRERGELHGCLEAVGAVAHRAVLHPGGVARNPRQAQTRAPAEPAARVAVEVEAHTVTVEVRAEHDAFLPREIAAEPIAQLLPPTRPRLVVITTTPLAPREP